MATFVADSDTGVNFNSLGFEDLVGDVLVTQSPTTWQTQFGFIGNDYVVYHGVGLTYSGGSPTGGTLNELQRYDSGALSYSFSGFSIPAATFHAYLLADDVQGFLGAILNGNDSLTGSNQDDWLIAYNGADTVYGNGGTDILDGGAGNDSMYGGAGTDLLYDQAGNDYMDGGTSDDWLDGGAGNDSMYGASGADLVYGQAGNDSLDGGTGNDFLYGGAGNDTYYVNSNSDTVTEDQAGAAGGTDKVYSTAANFVLSDNVEQLYLTGAADIHGTGNELNNTIVGNSGDNEIDGGTGNDTMTGGAGDDNYIIDSSKDVATEGAGAGGGFDTAYSSAATYVLNANIEQLQLTGNDDIDGTGNALGNYIQGNDGANVLNGVGGNDTIFALDGNDSINGGIGNDVIQGNGGDDVINLSQGNDTVIYTSFLDGHDILNSFDGDAAGGQDVFDLDWFLDQADVATEDRADLVAIVDNGASVDVGVNFLGGVIVFATLNTTSAVTVGEDVVVGTL